MAKPIFRRIGGRIVPLSKSALKKMGMNTPSVRSELAKNLKAARKGKGASGGSVAEVTRKFETTRGTVTKRFFMQVPKKGRANSVGGLIDRPSSKRSYNFVKPDGEDSKFIANIFSKAKKKRGRKK